MNRSNLRATAHLASALVWVALGFAASACVAKPPFHCQSDESCVSANGSHGTCEANGECTFHAGSGGGGNEAGADNEAGGAAAASGGMAGAPDDSNNGGGSHVGGATQGGGAGAAAAGEAGASCTDETANNCYSCHPTTSTQLLNACTSSLCVPFDDHTRIANLPASGELPKLPSASGQ